MHIDYLARVTKMLALPVERLVGNSSSNSPNNSRRMSLSPDSSTSTTSIRSSPSPSISLSSSPKCHCPKISSKISLNSPPSNEGEGIRIKVESPENSIEEDDRAHYHRFPINNRKSGEDVNHSDNHSVTLLSIKPSAQSHRDHLPKNDGNNGLNNGITHNNPEDDEGDIDVDGDDDKVSQNKGSSFSFKPFSSNFGLNLSKSQNNTPSGNGGSLKFSIEDILRPDFGLSKFQLLAQHHGHTRHQAKRARPSVPMSHPLRGPSSVSSSEGPRSPYKTSGSVIYHSEDSNGSCTSKGSRREPEVVDDTKVNPPVPEGPLLWPAWVYCTRYSDRPSSGPRSRRIRKEPREIPEEKRPRTAFTGEQLSKLKKEFDENRYLTEKRRQDLARDLKLHENQIKIWFQNKRAKLKKSTGTKNGLAMQLMAQGLYNHSTVPVDEDDEMMMEMQLMQQ